MNNNKTPKNNIKKCNFSQKLIINDKIAVKVNEK